MKYSASQSKSLLDMDVANYCEGLDPSYSTLGFDNADVFYGGGKCGWMRSTHTHTYTPMCTQNTGDYTFISLLVYIYSISFLIE